MRQKETIIAIATGSSSSGGLGVIRISGNKTKELLQAVFVAKHKSQQSTDSENNPKSDAFSFRPRYMHYGSFVLRALKNDFTNQNEKPVILDEILAVYFPAPFSYTGEDVAEIHAHGGSALLQNMLEHLLVIGKKLDANIRHAEAGEFTKRAFLNGRIDLSQAEAVAEIIAAPVLEGVKLAAAKLSGALGKRIEELRNQIEYIRRRLCLAIDFPDEEGECLPPHEFHALLDTLQNDMTKLIAAYERARPWSEGSLVVLAGQVNAGKSSLMNAILGRKRAIVTSEAGTTRDYLEEHTFLDGLSVRLTDTAGLREIAWLVKNTQNILQEKSQQENNNHNPAEEISVNNTLNSFSNQDDDINSTFLSPEILTRLEKALTHYNPQNIHVSSSAPISLIEAEGICRSLELMEEAQLILLVFDGAKLVNRLIQDTDITRINPIQKAQTLARYMQEELALLPNHVKKICIWNKTDKAPLETACTLALQEILRVQLLCLNAKESVHNQNNTQTLCDFNPVNNENIQNSQNFQNSIDELAKLSRKLLVSQEFNTDEIAPNRRQAKLLQEAHQELCYLKNEIDILPPDLTAIRLESAGQLLASITGISTIDETFNTIFEDFCIGK